MQREKLWIYPWDWFVMEKKLGVLKRNEQL